jgi:replicative DNA helicase
MVAQACYLAYPIRFDSSIGQWITTGSCEKVLFIGTEQDIDEYQTMIWAYLTDINEDKYTYGLLNEEEKQRTEIAIQITELFADNFVFARVSDPSIAQIKTIIRQNVLKYGIENIFYDYIFSSPNLLGEFRDLGIREDVALRMLSTALKDLAVELDVFVMTCTQASGDLDNEKGIKGYKYIRGSKSVADVADVGYVTTRVSKDDAEMIKKLSSPFGYLPNIVTDVYKVRRGRWIDVRIWSRIDLGTMRREDMFITDANYCEVKDFQIIRFVPPTNEYFQQLVAEFNKTAPMVNFEEAKGIEFIEEKINQTPVELEQANQEQEILDQLEKINSNLNFDDEKCECDIKESEEELLNECSSLIKESIEQSQMDTKARKKKAIDSWEL